MPRACRLLKMRAARAAMLRYFRAAMPIKIDLCRECSCHAQECDCRKSAMRSAKDAAPRRSYAVICACKRDAAAARKSERSRHAFIARAAQRLYVHVARY